MELEVSADKLPLPADAQPGDRLENGIISVVIRQEGIKIMTLVVEIYDRIVEDRETIETPAGIWYLSGYCRYAYPARKRSGAPGMVNSTPVRKLTTSLKTSVRGEG